MLHVVRLATIHPLLAHFTIGGLPLVVVAYALAVWRRSPAWTLVGDAALATTAALTLGTGIFGLVSNAVVPWPGGLERWRELHLVLGLATTLLLAALAGLRLGLRRPDAPAPPGVLVAALVVAAVAGGAGWIGGEVLVYHAGMAVRAAGEGALAPPVRDDAARPRDFLAAMREARAAWGSIHARLAWMLVQHPRAEDFARIIVDARRLQAVAAVMADEGAKDRDPRRADLLASMSQTLGGDGAEIEEAARKRSLQDLAHALGEASGHCADCHEQLRWKDRKGP
jgi:uncharacterized membrane protein